MGWLQVGGFLVDRTLLIIDLYYILLLSRKEEEEEVEEEEAEEGEKEKVLLADAMRSTIPVSGRLNPT